MNIELRKIFLLAFGVTLPFTNGKILGFGSYTFPLVFFPAFFALLYTSISGTWQVFNRLPLRNLIFLLLVYILFFGFYNASLGNDNNVKESLSIIIGISIYLGVVAILRASDDIFVFIKYIILGFFIQFLYIVYEIYCSFVGVFPSGNRISGFSPEPSMLADQLLVIYLPIFFSGFLFKPKLNGRLASKIFASSFGILTVLILIVLTKSRAAYVLLPILVVSAIALYLKKKRHLKQTIFEAAILLILLGILSWALFGYDNHSLDNLTSMYTGVDASIENKVWSNVTRFSSLKAGLAMTWSNPFGVGLGNSAGLIMDYLPSWAFASPELAPDSSLKVDIKSATVKFAAEFGWPIFGLVLYSFLKQQSKALSKYLSTNNVEIEFCLHLTILGLIASFPMSFIIGSYSWPSWIVMFGLQAAIYRIYEENTA